MSGTPTKGLSEEQKIGAGIRVSCGLEVSRDLPHTVLFLDDAYLHGVRQGAPGNHNVVPGDRIVEVDGHAVEHVPTGELCTMLNGNLNSIADITLISQKTGQPYTVYLKRLAVELPNHSSQQLTDFIVHQEKDLLLSTHNYSSARNSGQYGGSQHGGSQHGDGTEVMVGVGILMQQDPRDGALYVKSCVRGGAAARCGQIEEDDRILSVEGQSCEGASVTQTREMIVGIQGTPVRMCLQKPIGETYEVILTRGTAEYLDKLEEPSRKQEIQEEGFLGLLVTKDLPYAVAEIGDLVDVNSVVQGMPGYSNEDIVPGDLILRLDGRDVTNLSRSNLHKQLRGEIYSTVDITLRRRESGIVYTVRVLRQRHHEFFTAHDDSRTESLIKSATATLERMRANTPSLRSPTPTSFCDDPPVPEARTPRDSTAILENENLRNRNSELEVEVVNLQSLVSRLQQQIEFERGSAKSVSHEVDLVQQKYVEQIRELQTMLNDSEKARREAELQWQNYRKREAAVHEAIEKAKEQADQREKFYGDLCTKLEEERNHFETLVIQERDLRMRSDEERRQNEQMLDRMVKEVDRIKTAERHRREMEERLLQCMADAERQLQKVKSVEETVRIHSIENVQIFTQWQNDFFSNKTPQEAEVDSYFLA